MQHCGTCQNPAQTRKQKGLDQSEHVHHPKSFDRDAIGRKVNSVRTVNGHTHHKQEKPRSIFQSHAVVNKRTMMVEVGHATVAHPVFVTTVVTKTVGTDCCLPAMLRSDWS